MNHAASLARLHELRRSMLASKWEVQDYEAVSDAIAVLTAKGASAHERTIDQRIDDNTNEHVRVMKMQQEREQSLIDRGPTWREAHGMTRAQEDEEQEQRERAQAMSVREWDKRQARIEALKQERPGYIKQEATLNILPGAAFTLPAKPTPHMYKDGATSPVWQGHQPGH